MEQMQQMARASDAKRKPLCDAIMVDLETLGVTADSPILSIGAVKFQLNGDYIDDSGFYTTLALQPQIDAGRYISADTLAWWMGQSEEARAAFAEAQTSGMPMKDAMAAYVGWAKDGVDYLLWSNGADFDIPMVNHMLKDCGMKPITDFWNHRCFRTFKNEYKMVPQPPREGAHNALMDAIHQARWLQAIYKFKRGEAAELTKGFSAKK